MGAPTGGTAAGGGGGSTSPGDVPQTDALWSATIGGATRSGLDTGNVSNILYRGTKTLMQVPTIAGKSRAQEVCQGFPEISVSQAGASNAPGGGIKLRLDFDDCVVRVDELTSTIIGVQADQRAANPASRATAWPGRREVKAVPIALTTSAIENPITTADTRSLPLWKSRLIGSLEDAIQFDLTKVEIVRTYRRFTVPLEPASYTRTCRTRSPFAEHFLWSTKECLGAQSVVAGRVRAWARGRFDAQVGLQGASLNRSPRHTIYLHLEGSAAGDVTKTCTFSPYAIRHLEGTFSTLDWRFRWIFSPGPYGVSVDCKHAQIVSS